ncbi:MAG: hypothetical protein ACRDV1_12265, partial [Actinomycetes bacterium]
MPSITLLRSTAVVVLAVAALVPAVTPAHAAATPAIPTFSPAIDPYARYEAESGCSPTEKPGPQMLRSILTKTYGTSISTNIVRPCSASSSGHEEGRSLDWTTSVRVAAQKEMATAFIGWLLAKDGYGSTHAMVRRLGIQYVIWNNRMWRAYDPGRGWAEYSGCLATAKAGKAYDNACHRNHVHVSFSWDGAYKRTSYATGYVACPSFPSVPTPAALPTT